MSDKFAAERLPDLPNVGYSTTREKMLSDAIMMFMRDVERDRLRLLNIVLEGRETWRRIAGDIWRGLKVETDTLDAMYDYFVLQAAPVLDRQELLQNLQNPAKTKDILRRIYPVLEEQREGLKLMQQWAP